jgi:primosomal protein N'
MKCSNCNRKATDLLFHKEDFKPICRWCKNKHRPPAQRVSRLTRLFTHR